MSSRLRTSFDIFCLGFFAIVYFSYGMGSYPLQVPDEARYAEIAREMLQRHDFLLPHLHGLIYLEKPPFFYWYESLFIAQFGVTEWAVRLPVLIMSVLTILLTYGMGTIVFSRRIAYLASFILMTSSLFFVFAHTVTLDMPLTFFVTLSSFCFILACQTVASQPLLSLPLWGFYIAIALGVMTKGLVAIVLPLMTVIFWLIITKQSTRIRELKLFLGFMIVLCLVLPWHLAIAIKVPEFFNFYIVEQHFLRYLNDSAERTKPIWYYVPVVLLALLPWSVALLQSLRQMLTRSRISDVALKNAELFFLVQACVIVVFFSVSHAKLAAYVLPAMPAFAILIAVHLDLVVQHKVEARQFFFRGYVILCCILLLIAVMLVSHPSGHLSYYQAMLRQSAFVFFVSSLISFTVLYTATGFWGRILLMMILTSLNYAVLMHALPSIDYRSVKPLIEAVKSPQWANIPLLVYRGNFYDAPFYLRQLVVPVLPLKGEMKWPVEHTPDLVKITENNITPLRQLTKPMASPLAIENSNVLQRYWLSKEPLLLLTYRDDAQQLTWLHDSDIIAQHNDFVLLYNRVPNT